MRFPLLGLILVFIFGILGSSCTSEFNQALNSDDFEKQYETALTFYDAGKYELSKQLFDRVRGYYRSSNEFENILFKYAYSNFHLGEYVLAGHFFTQFETTYRRSPFKEEASFMSAYSDYKLNIYQ